MRIAGLHYNRAVVDYEKRVGVVEREIQVVKYRDHRAIRAKYGLRAIEDVNLIMDVETGYRLVEKKNTLVVGLAQRRYLGQYSRELNFLLLPA